jgi:ABC-type transport system involved in cytochrome bd biosynthesis fused ATPase/permease subunit
MTEGEKAIWAACFVHIYFELRRNVGDSQHSIDSACVAAEEASSLVETLGDAIPELEKYCCEYYADLAREMIGITKE